MIPSGILTKISYCSKIDKANDCSFRAFASDITDKYAIAFLKGRDSVEEQKAFKLVAPYQPTGDQPQAIDALVKGLEHGDSGQVLLGVTGSGKTFTMANVIQKINRPTLVLAHNKILAAQLCS